MRLYTPPPVSYAVGPVRLHAGLLLVLWLTGLLCWMGLELMGQARGLAVQAAGLVLLVCTGWLAWRSWQNTPRGTLCWDGQCWTWQAANQPIDHRTCHVSVSMDWQQTVLLHLRHNTAWHTGLWLWAEQKSQPERWLDLRRAVHAYTREFREH